MDVITGPSEVSDSEEEEEEEGDEEGDDDSSSNDSTTNTTTNTTATTEEPEADSSSHGGPPASLPSVILGMSGGAGQDPTLSSAACGMLVTGNDADNEDNESIINDAVTVGEDDDEVSC